MIKIFLISNPLVITNKIKRYSLLGRAQPVIPPNLYLYVNEHNSLGSPGKL